jgi:hypothetical protein
MKTNKWLNYTLGILLTLIVLTAVAGAGFRAGVTQNVNFAQFKDGVRPSFADNDFGESKRNQSHQDDKSGLAPQDLRVQGMDGGRGDFDRRDGGFSLLSPLFGLIRLLVLGALVWMGYTFVKRSGWRLSFSKASPAPAPVTESAVEEQKEAE